MLHCNVKHIQHRVIISVYVEYGNSLVMSFKLFQCEHLKKFFKCADTARNNNKRVRPVLHYAFSFTHTVGLDKLCAFGKNSSVNAHIFFLEEIRHNADYISVFFISAARNGAHKSRCACSVNKSVSSVRYITSKLFHSVNECFVNRTARSTEYTNVHMCCLQSFY